MSATTTTSSLPKSVLLVALRRRCLHSTIEDYLSPQSFARVHVRQGRAEHLSKRARENSRLSGATEPGMWGGWVPILGDHPFALPPLLPPAISEPLIVVRWGTVNRLARSCRAHERIAPRRHGLVSVAGSGEIVVQCSACSSLNIRGEVGKQSRTARGRLSGCTLCQLRDHG